MRLYLDCCVACLLTVALPLGFASADEASVRKAIEGYVQAFNAKDAKSLSAMWSEDATHVDHELAQRTTGRDEIMADIEAVFARPESVMLSGTVDDVRMVTDNVAHVGGQVMVTVGGEEPTSTQYSAVLVKNGDQWSIDTMEEFALPQPLSASSALSQLDWLIGTWNDTSGSIAVRSTVRLADGGSFLIRSFEAQSDSESMSKSTQIIGWDPRSQQIHSWTFNGDGSFGEGQWSKSADQWMIKSTQTLADGRTASGTYILSPSNQDEFSIQLVAHEIEGELQPSTPAVVVQRANAATDTASAPQPNE